MATDEEYTVTESWSAPTTVEAPAAAPESVVDPGLIMVVNKTRVEMDITLRDGTNLRLGPWVKNGVRNISKPVYRKLLPPYVLRMEKEGSLSIVGGSK
jgi:hypothetical protein